MTHVAIVYHSGYRHLGRRVAEATARWRLGEPASEARVTVRGLTRAW